MEWPHLIDNALKAHYLYRRDYEYMVENDEIIIVDEFTGRKMIGPAVVRRPAPGGRGQGAGQDQGREPDPGHHHPPELLQALQQLA